MRAEITALAIAGLLVSASDVDAGGPLLIFDPPTRTPYSYAPGVDVYTDLGDLGPTLTNAEADALTASGYAEWTAVATSVFSAAVAGDFASIGLPDITGANAGMVVGVFNGGGIHVMYDHDGSIITGFFGAPPGVLGIATPEFSTGSTLLESWAVMNGTSVHPADAIGTFFAGVFTHEFGHSINLAHTQTNGAFTFFGAANGPAACPLPYGGSPGFGDIETMYPFIDVSVGGPGADFATVDQLDDVASVSNVYPSGGWPGAFGSITGTIFMDDEVTEITGVNVVARNLADPFADCNSALSGDYTQGALGPDGLYTLNGLTPGADYALYVDGIVAGGFSTPPAALGPGLEEFYNGVYEFGNPAMDDRCAFTPVVPNGSPVTADVILNFARARPGVCYGSTGNADGGRVITIDPGSGAATLVSDPVLGQIPGIAIDSIGRLFASDGPGNLFRVDAITGAELEVGAMGFFVSGIAFDDTDVLYGVSNGFPPFTLFEIDTGTGAATPIGVTPDAFAGIAFDPLNGDLYASVSGASGGGTVPDGLYLVDKTTGDGVLIGETGLDGGTPDIHFDSDGNLFGVKGGGVAADNVFISIDKATGAGAEIGPTGFTSVSGLAFLQSTRAVGAPALATPSPYVLHVASPNPFNPTTRIRFVSPDDAHVRIDVFDVTGRHVTTLVDEVMRAGFHTVPFSAGRLASGVYFYEMTSGAFHDVRRMTLLR